MTVNPEHSSGWFHSTSMGCFNKCYTLNTITVDWNSKTPVLLVLTKHPQAHCVWPEVMWEWLEEGEPFRSGEPQAIKGHPPFIQPQLLSAGHRWRQMDTGSGLLQQPWDREDEGDALFLNDDTFFSNDGVAAMSIHPDLKAKGHPISGKKRGRDRSCYLLNICLSGQAAAHSETGQH